MKHILAAIFFILGYIVFFSNSWGFPSLAPPNFNNSWNYAITASPDLRELYVTAKFPPLNTLEFSVNYYAESFVRDVEVDTGTGWRKIVPQDDSWYLPSICRTRECQLRYRYLIADAARNINDIEIAKLHNEEAVLAPPSTWLMRPLSGATGRKIVFRFAPSNGYNFASGNFPFKEADSEFYEFPAGAIDEASYAILGKLRQYSVTTKGGLVDIAIAPGEFAAGDKAIVKWIGDAARSISGYYNDFPVRRVLVIVRPVSGNRVSYASTLGNGGAAICVQVGRDARPTTLSEDWIMTHELVHCMFPSVPRGRHAWAEEGLATYVEPWARVRTGLVSAEEAWGDLVRDLPQGVPTESFRGLDYTDTWSNVYWSGALFYFLADVEIRQRTQNRYGLDEALRGIAAAGGTVNVDWDISRTFAAGDRAVGVPVLTDLYKQMRASSFEVDLVDLWKKLGVERRGNSITFNDRAPWANIRQAITVGNTRARRSLEKGADNLATITE